ncbi:MAG: hypothetical protein ACTSV7_14960 [Candidatus Baldrarchaeia archaeon]
MLSFKEEILLMLILPVAFSYFPGDTINVYSVEPCESLKVYVNSYGLSFLDCNEITPVMFECSCINNRFDLVARIKDDAPATTYTISIEIHLPTEETKIEEKEIAYVPSGGGKKPPAKYYKPAPTSLPIPETPSPTETPVPTESPTPAEPSPSPTITETPEFPEVTDCNRLKALYETLLAKHKKLKSEYNEIKEERDTWIVMATNCYDTAYESQRKCEQEKRAWAVAFLISSIMLLAFLYAFFRKPPEKDKNLESPTTPLEKPCYGGAAH